MIRKFPGPPSGILYDNRGLRGHKFCRKTLDPKLRFPHGVGVNVPTNSDLLGVHAVAELAGKSPSWVRLQDDELMPIRDWNGRRLYARGVIEQWLADREERTR